MTKPVSLGLRRRVPHMVAGAAIVCVNAVQAGYWVYERLKRLFGGTPAPPDNASL